jgi:hypothetical protein
MIRKQISKILVFLLMLGLLYGCKRQILDPLNPQTNLPQKAQLDKVKRFYEKGRYKNQPKTTSGNERMSAADSARFKDFEPEWDKTEVELLPNNEKMLIVPVVRFLSVEYNQDMGFIRRLCIRVDANDDFLEANIVELVGNLTFVKSNYNTIFKNYKNASITGFTGVVIINEIDYDLQKVQFYENGTFKQTTLIKTEDSEPITGRLSACTSYTEVWIPVSTCSNVGLPTHTGLFCGCASGGYWETTAVLYPCYIGDTTPAGVPLPPNGNGGGDGGTTFEPPLDGTSLPELPPAPCKGKNCPPRDGGVSWDNEIILSQPIKGDTTTYKSIKAYSYALLKQTRIRAKTSKINFIQARFNKRAVALNDLIVIMMHIEANKKRLELEIIIDPNMVDKASTSYNPTTKRLEIKIAAMPTMSATPTEEEKEKMLKYIALYAHELMHVEQVLFGRLSYKKTTVGSGALYDIWDEKECYQFQYEIFDPSIMYPTQIDDAFIDNLGVYTGIQTSNITIKNLTAAELATVIANDYYIPQP